MKTEEVPQDNSKTYGGHNKLLYAKSSADGYTPVKSSGWDVESAATQDAVDYFNLLAAQAADKVAQGIYSPLYYHMYKNRMDLPLLAQTSGFFQWQTKRHFKPAIFRKLSHKQLERYAKAMNLSTNQLQQLPEKL